MVACPGEMLSSGRVLGGRMGVSVRAEDASEGLLMGPARRLRLRFGQLCGVVALLSVVFGWFGASGTRVFSDQLSYIASGQILGLFLLGVAATLIVTDSLVSQVEVINDRGDLLVLREGILHETLTDFRGEHVGSTHEISPAAPSMAPGEDDPNGHTLVAVQGARRIHRGNRALVLAKRSAHELNASEALEAGLILCRVCQPGGSAHGSGRLLMGDDGSSKASCARSDVEESR